MEEGSCSRKQFPDGFPATLGAGRPRHHDNDEFHDAKCCHDAVSLAEAGFAPPAMVAPRPQTTGAHTTGGAVRNRRAHSAPSQESSSSYASSAAASAFKARRSQGASPQRQQQEGSLGGAVWRHWFGPNGKAGSGDHHDRIVDIMGSAHLYPPHATDLYPPPGHPAHGGWGVKALYLKPRKWIHDMVVSKPKILHH